MIFDAQPGIREIDENTDGVSTFSKWAKLATKRGGASSSPKVVLPQFVERLCVSIRAAKARAVIRRAHTSDDVSGPPVAQALDAAGLF